CSANPPQLHSFPTRRSSDLNTMSTVMEFIGLSPMGFNGIPAMDLRKDEVSFRCGEVVMNLLRKGIRPSDILTRKAFENAIAGVADRKSTRLNSSHRTISYAV